MLPLKNLTDIIVGEIVEFLCQSCLITEKFEGGIIMNVIKNILTGGTFQSEYFYFLIKISIAPIKFIV